MLYFIAVSIFLILLSFIFDRKKTYNGIIKGLTMFLKILPTLLSVIILISIVLYLIPNEFLLENFGQDSGAMGYIFAALAGSVTLMPGFIAYPVCGFLIKNGIGYPIIAVFITTLMMVGVMTLPIEKKFFGLKIALIRNILSFVGAIIIGTLIGLLWNVL